VRTGATTAKRKAGTVGAGTRSQLQANAAKVTKDRIRAVSKAASKGTKKMDKAPTNATKQEYQALRSQQRRNKRYDWAATKSDSAKAAGVTRKLNSMVKSRGVSKPAKSTKPGATMQPLALITRLGEKSAGAWPMATMRPAAIATSQIWSKPLEGSMTRPFWMRSFIVCFLIG
jgi:hypothetical protein